MKKRKSWIMSFVDYCTRLERTSPLEAVLIFVLVGTFVCMTGLILIAIIHDEIVDHTGDSK